MISNIYSCSNIAGMIVHSLSLFVTNNIQHLSQIVADAYIVPGLVLDSILDNFP